MSAQFILFIAILRLLSPRRLFKPLVVSLIGLLWATCAPTGGTLLDSCAFRANPCQHFLTAK